MAQRYPKELRERATRMALERLSEYGSAYKVARALGPKLGVKHEALRRWVVQAQIDQGQAAGTSTETQAEIRRLQARVRELEEANEILKAASVFSAGELDPRRR